MFTTMEAELGENLPVACVSRVEWENGGDRLKIQVVTGPYESLKCCTEPRFNNSLLRKGGILCSLLARIQLQVGRSISQIDDPTV
jgi:hypothetical protein